MNYLCPNFQGEIFHKWSIVLACYIILMPANSIILFIKQLYYTCQYSGVFQSRVRCRGDTMFTRMYGPLQLE